MEGLQKYWIKHLTTPYTAGDNWVATGRRQRPLLALMSEVREMEFP